MYKQYLAVLFLLFFCAVSKGQEGFTQGRLKFTIRNDGVVDLSESESSMALYHSQHNKILVIPCKVFYEGRTYTVQSVQGFNYDSDLEQVFIEDGVECIEEAFSHCPNLRAVYIGRDVEQMYRSFQWNPMLERIVVDKNNSTYDSRGDCNAIIETKANRLICGCKTTIIPAQIQAIGEEAFLGCEDFDEMLLPEGILILEDNAFSECINLKNINLPQSLKKIECEVFSGCTSLTSVNIPQQVEDIGLEVFTGCSSLDTIVVDKRNQKYDSRCGCNAIIETSTHKLIAGCRSSFIPNGVREIEDNAFSSIPIESVIVPKSVVKMGMRVFAGCNHLAEIQVDKQNPVFDSRHNCNAVVETESNTIVAASMNTTFDISVTAIGNYAFSGIPTPSVVNIPEGITKIGSGAFSSNKYVSRLILPKSLESVGQNAFGDCWSLHEIRWKGYVKTIETGVFRNCPSLWRVEIPEGTQTIRADAFGWCKNLCFVILPSTLETIEQQAFEGCPVDSVLKTTPDNIGCTHLK